MKYFVKLIIIFFAIPLFINAKKVGDLDASEKADATLKVDEISNTLAPITSSIEPIFAVKFGNDYPVVPAPTESEINEITTDQIDGLLAAIKTIKFSGGAIDPKIDNLVKAVLASTAALAEIITKIDDPTTIKIGPKSKRVLKALLPAIDASTK